MGTKWEQSGNKVGTMNPKMGQEWEQSGNKVGTRTPKWDKNGNKVGTDRPKRKTVGAVLGCLNQLSALAGHGVWLFFRFEQFLPPSAGGSPVTLVLR